MQTAKEFTVDQDNMPDDAPAELAGVALTMTAQDDFERLHTMDRRAWLRRSGPAIEAIAPFVRPRCLVLKYAGPYRAHMLLQDLDGQTVDCGLIELSEPTV
jgi:hypothetical protein